MAATVGTTGFTPKVTHVARRGTPATAIMDQADEQPDTLVVIGTHGRSGIGRVLLGSVADEVVRVSGRPTFIVRCKAGYAKPVVAPAAIVLPLDGSEASEKAVPHAVAVAKATGSRIVLLHIHADPVAKGYLDGVASRIKADGVANVEVRLSDADPKRAIIEAAGSAGDSWVVMSTHGRSGLKRMALGGVADHVVRRSSGPVLAIHP
jgi:nucleotide-binding universal stress UspA family protein